jgi:thioredoxin reductase (NADPH)
VLLAVDDDAASRQRIRAELERRYGEDYRVTCADSPPTALGELQRAREAGDEVALVLADQWMGELTGSELLGSVRTLHPDAKRALLVEWGSWGHEPTREAILEAMALGRMDYYVLKPTRPSDEYFHRAVTEFLHEWSREHLAIGHEVVLIAEPATPRGHEIADLLRRSGIPFAFHRSDTPAGKRLVAQTATETVHGPVLRLHDDTVLVDPTNEEIAAAYGVDTDPPVGAYADLTIVGAGPAGLSAAVYAASEGLRTMVIERHAIGGQAGSSSLIRNYLGFSRGVSGGELSQRAYQQAWVFGARFAIAREAVALEPGDPYHGISCNAGFTGTAGAVVLATGVSYRRVGIPTLDALTGAGVFYGASTAAAHAVRREHVYVVGGGNSAGQATLHLSRSAGSVTLLVRGASLATGMSQYLREAIAAAPNVEVRTQTEVVGGGGDGRVEWLELRDRPTGDPTRVPAAALFVMIGGRPRTEWLPAAIARDGGGYVLTGADVVADEVGGALWPLERLPMSFETSVPGVFAVGDVRHGSTQRVASAVGEGAVAVPQVHEWLAQKGGGGAAAMAAEELQPQPPSGTG